MASPDIQIREDTIYGASKPNNGGSEKAILGWATDQKLYRLDFYVSRLALLTFKNRGITPWDKLTGFRGSRLKTGLEELRINETDQLVQRICSEARTRGLIDGIAVKLGEKGFVSPPLEHELALWGAVNNQDLRAYQRIVVGAGQNIRVHGVHPNLYERNRADHRKNT